MSTFRNNYDLLIDKLDAFTRKFYVNQAIRGALYSVGVVIGLFIVAALLENLFFNNLTPSAATTPRKVLFFGFLGLSTAALVYWVAMPLFHFFRLGKVISHEQAAQIVGTHFTSVKDKLLNVLQLKRQSTDFTDASLIMASIHQKTEELKPVPFVNAIDLGKNRKYLRYALPPLLLLLFLLVAAPGLIPGSANRLLNNGKEYEPEAPFAFVLDNANPQVGQFEDFNLDVRVEGKEMPAEAFIEVDNYTYKLTKKEGNVFTFTFSKVAKDTEFRFRGGGVESKAYTLDVLEKPNIVGFEVRLDYPAYTGRNDEDLSNIGDLVVPAGTNIVWTFSARNTDNLAVKFGLQDSPAEQTSREVFTLRRQVKNDELYKVFVSNKYLPKADSVAYTLTVIPDQHPAINAQRFEDSLDQRNIFFAGEASDDYGIRSLAFQYQINHDGKDGQLVTIPLKSGGKQASFEYSFTTREMELKPGDKVTYYFEVWDNDGVNGSKSTRTQSFTYNVPTLDEMAKQEQQNNSEIEKKLEQAAKEAMALKQNARKLQDEIIQKKDIDWQDRKKMEKLLDQQKEVEKQFNEAKESFKENLENQKEFQKSNPQLMEKQEKLEKLFDEVMDEETKELFRKLEELMQELDKTQMKEELQNMQLNDDQLQKEMDRMLELFKQLEVEKNIQDAISQLDSLAKKEEQLSKDTEEGKKTPEELKKEQEAIDKEFDKVQEKLDEAKKKNEELETPNKMEDTKEQEQEIEKDMKESSQQLQKNQKSGASKSQKKASEKMKNLSNSLSMMMQSSELEQMEEDMKAMRQLLENLVQLSFDQEKLMDRVLSVDVNTPAYVKSVQEQNKVKDDFRIIEDSLQALSKRVFQIEAFITEKVTDVKKHLGKGIGLLEERMRDQATVEQQYTMTGLNDLALMLNEAMQQMQEQAAQKMEGSQMCQKPGGSKPNKSGKGGKKGMGDLQKDLNGQMKDAQEGLKSGKSPNGMSKEFAQMAAKQAAIRKALQELQKEKQARGQGSKELQDLMDQMDKTETELVNKKLTNETMNRQQEILTRLLESDRAEREREQDEKRESKTGRDIDRKMPPAMEEYLKKRQAQIDMFKTVSPNLKPFYKNLVEEYFESLK